MTDHGINRVYLLQKWQYVEKISFSHFFLIILYIYSYLYANKRALICFSACLVLLNLTLTCLCSQVSSRDEKKRRSEMPQPLSSKDAAPHLSPVFHIRTVAMHHAKASSVQRCLIENIAVCDLAKPLLTYPWEPWEISVSAISSICFNYPDAGKLKIPKQLLVSTRTWQKPLSWLGGEARYL